MEPAAFLQNLPQPYRPCTAAANIAAFKPFFKAASWRGVIAEESVVKSRTEHNGETAANG